MLLQYLHGLWIVVLAANRKDDSRLMEVENDPLQRTKGSAGILQSNVNSFRAILPDHAAPQGIVEVYREDLACLACKHMHESHPFARHAHMIRCGNGHAHGQPFFFIAP